MYPKCKYFLSGILLTASMHAFSDDLPALPDGNSQTANDISTLTTYLQNLGEYFGYDLTKYCTSGGQCSNQGGGNNSGGGSNASYSNRLFYPDDASGAQLSLFNNFLGALIGANTNNPLLPSGIQGYSNTTKTLAGQSFATPPYSTPSAQSVSVIPIIDQQTYQTDPVNQALLNLLSTTDYTYCQNNSSSSTCTKAPFFREQIMLNVVGPIGPLDTNQVFTPQQNLNILSQVNVNSLLTPLMYTTGSESSSNNMVNNSPAITISPTGSLTAQNQAQQAANFIRYASSSVNPATLPSWTTYNNLYLLATNSAGNTSQQDQAAAYVSIANYLTKFRSFAAQGSVGISNLYYIMSRRLPQNNSSLLGSESSSKSVSANGTNSSEALDEFVMASWRLYNPNAPASQQWLNRINQGSAASVQKEMAILLAEINYQLYLSRQQQERLLLTQSILLLQNSALNVPDPSMGTNNSSSGDNNSGSSSSSSSPSS